MKTRGGESLHAFLPAQHLPLYQLADLLRIVDFLKSHTGNTAPVLPAAVVSGPVKPDGSNTTPAKLFM